MEEGGAAVPHLYPDPVAVQRTRIGLTVRFANA
jgi:hypothetical protein